MAELIMQEEGSTPSTPSSGKWKAYFKSTGLFILEDNGTEIGPFLRDAAGTYTPTLTNVANVDTSSVVGVFMYSRVGNIVTVSGAITVDPTAATTQTDVRFTLPIASNLAAVTDCAGTGAAQSVDDNANVLADIATDTALLRFTSNGTASITFRIVFQYIVQ